MNFKFFGKKDTAATEQPNQTDDQKAKAAELSTASQLLIVTAATNFGLVVLPDTKKPLMFKMEASDTIASCVERNAPYISAAVDVASCLVVPLAAQLPNNTYAANKIFGLILPDPGVLINNDLVVVGYEEIDKVPGATTSMLQMLVKQVPREYFAVTTVDPSRKNGTSTTTGAASAPVAPAPAAVATPAITEPSAPIANSVDQVISPVAPVVAEAPTVAERAPASVAPTEPAAQVVTSPALEPPKPENPVQTV